MQDDSLDQALKVFPRATENDWKRAAKKESDGNDPFESLSWHTDDGILCLPYYEATSASNSSQTDNLATKSRWAWLNVPKVEKTSSIDEHVRNGAEGVVLDLRKYREIDPASIPPSCPLLAFYIKPGFTTEAFRTLISGGRQIVWMWDGVPSTEHIAAFADAFHGIWVPPATPAEEAASALVSGIALFERLAEIFPAEDAFRKIRFSLPCNAKVVETVAKLRAMRSLWLHVARVYGFELYKPEDVHLHARSSFAPDSNYGPQENMLKGTFSAIGAVLGGCDSLTVETEEEPAFARRWARNVSHILKAESFLDSTIDPLGGAHAVETLTEALSQRAWQKFLERLSTV